MKRAVLQVGRSELAQLLGVRASRVTKYVAEGMPTQSSGRGKPATFDVGACLRWFLERRAPKPGEDERVRYFRLQGDKIEQDIRARAGELVEASDVEQRWSGIVTAARERFLSVPATALQRGLVDVAGEEQLIALVDEALSELSSRGAAHA